MARIAAGVYTAVAKGGGELGWTKGGGEQIAICFELLDGESAGAEITWYGYFTEKTIARTLESLRYAGWRGDDLQDLSGLGSIQCQLVIEDEVGTNGKTYARVRWVNRLGGGGRVKLERPMSADERRLFAAEMRVRAQAIPVVGGIPAPTAASKPPPVRDPSWVAGGPPDPDGGASSSSSSSPPADRWQPKPPDDSDVPF